MSHPYASRSGCPLCTIVALAPSSPTPFATSQQKSFPVIATAPSGAQVVYKDRDVTAYIERKAPVSSRGHAVLVFNLHVPSIYSLSSSDLPLLISLQTLCTSLLFSLHASSSSTSTTVSTPPVYNIGFITPPLYDPKLPVTDHLHLHAYIGRPDRAGWWRGVAFGMVGWYALEDLIAEIRESTSNNRIKAYPSQAPSHPSTTASSFPSRPPRPIDLVPGAGARSGLPNGVEITDTGIQALGNADAANEPHGEEGIRTPTSATPLQGERWGG